MQISSSFLRRALAWVLGGAALFCQPGLATASRPPARPVMAPPVSARASVAQSFGQLPLRFEVNRGQAAQPVKFLAQGAGATTYLLADEMVLALSRAEIDQSAVVGKPSFEPEPPVTRRTATVRLQLRGANPQPRVAGLDELPGRSNYFSGNDPAGWITDVPTYTRVQYTGVYPGIDAVYYSQAGELEYDFIVQPGADPRQIRLRVAGAERAWLDSSGELVLETAAGQMRQRKPARRAQGGSGGGLCLARGGRTGVRVGGL